MFGFIHLIGPEEYRCHVLCCNPTAIELSQTLQEACVVSTLPIYVGLIFWGIFTHDLGKIALASRWNCYVIIT